MKITLDIGEEINVGELIELIKNSYPGKKIAFDEPKYNPEIFNLKNLGPKIFGGVRDLETLHIEDFTMYAREELYDR